MTEEQNIVTDGLAGADAVGGPLAVVRALTIGVTEEGHIHFNRVCSFFFTRKSQIGNTETR